MRKIRVAIVGVGNCASALVQGLAFYRGRNSDAPGLITPVLGGYTPADIEIVAAFDVADNKVGLPLNLAIWAEPNNTMDFASPETYDVVVQRGMTLDGLGRYVGEVVNESTLKPVRVAEVLRSVLVDVVVNYLPVGSEEAARYYAREALAADCNFINCMPAFITQEMAGDFERAGLAIIGDDIKSQVGATILHRALVTLLRERGVTLLRTSQLNVGGNADFLNMLERDRLVSKKLSKTQAVTSVMGTEIPANCVHIGPSDYVPWLEDRKWAHIRLEAAGFGGAPMSIEVKLDVWDSPNSAGVVMDAIRCIGVAQDRGISGPLLEASAWYMKSPPSQVDDDVARSMLLHWLGDEP